MLHEPWNSNGWASSAAGRGGLVGGISVPARANANSHGTQSQSNSHTPGGGMGGVGLVFYRDPRTPYLLVKEVVADGPAFKSGLLYPGDRLVAINDFDLAWSGTTPRSQQPQLPGKHGTTVTLTFDRSSDGSPYPERFSINLLRDGAFYPDRLSSSPYRPFLDHELTDLMKKSPDAAKSAGQPKSGGKKVPALSSSSHAEIGRSGVFSWDSPSQAPQRVPNLSTSGRSSNSVYDRNSVLVSSAHLTNESIARRQIGTPQRDVMGYGRQQPAWDATRGTDERGNNDDLDELIQEIARNDQILELQNKLNSAEIDHDRRVKEFQRNQAGLEELVRNLRVELESSRDQVKNLQNQLHRNLEESSLTESRLAAMKSHEDHIRDLQAQVAKERVQRQAAERRITVERENSLQKMQIYESEMRAQLEVLESELEKEREVRLQLEQRVSSSRGPDAQALRHVHMERDALAAQNQKFEAEAKDLRHQLQEAQNRVACAMQQRDEHTYTQTHSYTRALEENKMLADQVRGLEKALANVTSKMDEQSEHLAQVRARADELERARVEDVANNSWDIPGVPGPQTPDAAPNGANSSRQDPGLAPIRESHDVELHQSPSTAQIAGNNAQNAPPITQWSEPPKPLPNNKDKGPIYVSPRQSTLSQHSSLQQQAQQMQFAKVNSVGGTQYDQGVQQFDPSQHSPAHYPSEPADSMHSNQAYEPQYQGSAPQQQNEEEERRPIQMQQEQERLEQERLEKERLKQERIERERQEQERQEQERQKHERQERERQEQERQQQQQQQAEAARQQQEAEQQRLQQEQQQQQQQQQQQLAQRKPLTAPTPPQAVAAVPGANVVKAGIGMSFQANPESRLYIITEVHPGGPAGLAVRAGIMIIGDALLEVNGASVDGKQIPQIVQEILGAEHTPVYLTISRMQDGQLTGPKIILELLRARPDTIPPEKADKMVRVVSGLPGKEEAEDVVLPPGWVAEVDPSSKRTYYVNHTLKTFSWARPKPA